MAFKKITAAELAANETLRRYLTGASRLDSARKGGVFVGNRDIAPDSLRDFGIVLPKGGMILPDESLEGVLAALREARQEVEKAAEEAAEKSREERLAATQAALAAAYGRGEKEVHLHLEASQEEFYSWLASLPETATFGFRNLEGALKRWAGSQVGVASSWLFREKLGDPFHGLSHSDEFGISRTHALIHVPAWMDDWVRWSRTRPGAVYRRSRTGFARNLWCANHSEAGHGLWSRDDVLTLLYHWRGEGECPPEGPSRRRRERDFMTGPFRSYPG